MKLSYEGLQQKEAWKNAGVTLPEYDWKAMCEATEKAPVWVHFGAGNIFRGFIAGLQQRLLNQGLAKSGIVAAETFDYDIIDKIYAPFDNMTLMVSLLPDGSMKKEVLASIAGGLRAGNAYPQDLDALRTVGMDAALIAPEEAVPQGTDYLVSFAPLGADSPVPGRVDAKRAEELLGTLCGEPSAAVRRCQESIAAWQNAPDTPEQLETIPRLRLDQVPAEPEKLPLAEEVSSHITLLRHDLPTSGITYCNLYFALDDLTPGELSKASFMARLFGSLDTEKYALADLSREMRSLFGDIRFMIEAYGQQNAPARCRTFLCVSCSVLDAKLEKALSFLTELLTGQRWENSDQVLAFLRQQRAAMAEQLVMAGHNAAMSRVLACSTAEGAVQEQASGITFLRWLTELEQDFPARFPALAEDLKALSRRVFCCVRMTISVTAGDKSSAGTAARLLSSSLPDGSFVLPCAASILPWEPRREGIVIPSGVSYAALGGLFQEAGRGAAKVMGHTVSLAHLWNTVRVQGGAYGTGMVLRDTGFAGFFSYRDPSAARTMDCYRNSAGFLRGIGDMDLTGMITGTVAESDPLLTPRMKGKVSDALYWRRISHEDRCRVRREMLSTVPDDLASLADPVEELAARGSVCILGSRQQVDACAGWLDNIMVL